MTEWQPIETAPINTHILLFVPENGFYIGWAWPGFPDDKHIFFHASEIGEINPTHWMPLPEPPAK